MGARKDAVYLLAAAACISHMTIEEVDIQRLADPKLFHQKLVC